MNLSDIKAVLEIRNQSKVSQTMTSELEAELIKKQPLAVSRRLKTCYLNTIYFTLITQKAHKTYRRLLGSTDVGILWSYAVEETGVLERNHRPWMGVEYYQELLLYENFTWFINPKQQETF